MLYYLGKGTELKKEECKEYKTVEGALKAAAKDETLVVWDETGKVIGSLTDNEPEGALKTNPDGSVNAYDAEGNKVGTVDHATVAAVTGNTQQDTGNAPQNDRDSAGQTNTPLTPENGQNGANTKSEGGQNPDEAAVTGNTQQDTGNAPQNNGQGQQGEQEVIVPQGTMKVTVVCDGALNLRRSPEWGNGNICGRAVRGQSYYVKAIHTVAGKKMVQTVDDIFLSGQSEHVQFEQL